MLKESNKVEINKSEQFSMHLYFSLNSFIH